MRTRFWIYMMSNSHGNVLYIGVTNNLERRVCEHKSGTISGFTQKYNCYCLVYYEEYKYINDAIAREKQLKGWRRARKEELIKMLNPERIDLVKDW